LAGIAVAGAVALAGCNTDDVSPNSRAMRPLPPALVAEIEAKKMPPESPILVRIFKEKSKLEVQEGDRQAPEGFYNIAPGQMNPTSNYYLAFNLGFPNTYDKANDRTGAFLMVHGDCSSAGCYAMTDEQIQEIYALGRDSFIGGQKSFQVQAYPFRMTALNMARHRNNPNLAFWRMIKEGNDHFEATKTEPRVDVCEKRYVFDARAPANATPIVFRPREKCPVYEIPPEIAEPVKAKHDGDERAFADHVRRGVATVAVRTGTDGGMHPSFLARLRLQHGEFDSHILTGEVSSIPVPPTVNPLREPEPETTSAVNAAAAASTVPVASNPAAVKKAPSPPPKSTVAALHVPAKPQADAPPGAKAAPVATPSGSSSAQPAPWPSDPKPGLITRAAPVVPRVSFDGRWGGVR
jgi:murein L,D-transpeptidase YafK